MTESAAVVTLAYDDLVAFDRTNPNQTLVDQIGQAFGAHDQALGLLAVSGVPDWETLRENLLPLAAKLPMLPDLPESPESMYSTGWSHGREQLAPGKPDTAKGSYYGNPKTDTLLDDLIRRDPNKSDYWKEQAKEHSSFYCENVWPESLPELQTSFRAAGQCMQQVGVRVAAVCDVYCQQQGVETRFEETLRDSLNMKGRLLHYFAVDEGSSADDGAMWCGWHNDHVRIEANRVFRAPSNLHR